MEISMTDKQNIDHSQANEITGSNENVPQATPTTKPDSIRWAKVILTAVGVVTLGASIAGLMWYVANIEPALHPVSGYVFLDGEPMDGGAILLQHAK